MAPESVFRCLVRFSTGISFFFSCFLLLLFSFFLTSLRIKKYTTVLKNTIVYYTKHVIIMLLTCLSRLIIFFIFLKQLFRELFSFIRYISYDHFSCFLFTAISVICCHTYSYDSKSHKLDFILSLKLFQVKNASHLFKEFGIFSFSL